MLEATAHPARSARGHLRIMALEAGVPRSRVDELLELVELSSSADRRVGGFSLGMRQRLGLAGALIGDPRVLVLDEPANGLDPEGVRWLRDFLVGLAAEGRTILLSSHVLAEVAQTVDEVVVIASGQLVVHAPLAEVMRRSDNRRVRLRTPESEGLHAALLAEDMTVSVDEGELVITGGDQEAIAQLAFDRGFALYEIATEASSLEDVFLDLTAVPEEAVR
jgi:ABC-2 type transport system ATP-binding protein